MSGKVFNSKEEIKYNAMIVDSELIKYMLKCDRDRNINNVRGIKRKREE